FVRALSSFLHLSAPPLFFFQSYRVHRALHSFPTRRSSDLVKLCMDVCCLTDYEELIKAHGLQGHGIYYYVPSLLKHFQTAEINELIVPRAHLSVNGKRDDLTPPVGVNKVRNYLLPLYRKYGKEAELRVELFDCAHVELPEMRKLIQEWMDRCLAGAPRN